MIANIVLNVLLFAYVGIVIYAASRIALRSEGEIVDAVRDDEDEFNLLLKRKDQICGEKLGLEDEAMKIFTLYEITKDITSSLREKEAFDIFRHKLTEHIDFQECILVEPDIEIIKKYRKDDQYFIYPLQGKKRRIGYLVFRGVVEADQEKISILGNQFALALRRVKLYSEIEKIAITDSLTQVHTRHYTLERFEEELNRSKVRKMKLSFLMIDVDHFKEFNDTYGHMTGDQILHEVGRLVKESTREIDIAGRFGGEEFCVVLPDTDQEGALYVADRIRSSIEEATIKAYDTEVKSTVSIGISTFSKDGKNVDELIDKADWALYRAKKQGRNRVCSFGVYDD